jgi:mercuric reductase
MKHQAPSTFQARANTTYDLMVIGGGSAGFAAAIKAAELGVTVAIVERGTIGGTCVNIGCVPSKTLIRAVEVCYKCTYTQFEGLPSCPLPSDWQRIVRQKDELVAQLRQGKTAGRRPNTQNPGLEAATVRVGPRGEIVVNEHLQTTNPNIYAAGDCLGEPMYVYVAAYAGGLAAENALQGNKRTYDLTALPRVTFTDPQIASVGLGEAQAKERGLTVKTALLPLKDVPRAIVARDTRGLIKLIVEAETGKLVGAHVLADEAGEVIQEATVAMRFGLTLQDILETFHPYLTMVEGLKLAALTFEKDVTKLSCCAT